MFTKMIVASDLSSVSDRIIGTLGALVALGAKEALLVHCFDISYVGTLADRLLALAMPTLERQKQTLESCGFDADAQIVLGAPEIEINRLAEDNKCDVVVVGAHVQQPDRSPNSESVTGAIIEHASMPVLVVRTGYSPTAEPSDERFAPLDHILFPTDFSDNSERAFAVVLKLCEGGGVKRATLMHVQDKGNIERHMKDRLDVFNRVDRERLEAVRAQLVASGVSRVDIEIPYGSPKHEVIARTRKGDVSLVVVGCQGRGASGDAFLGSVSYAVVNHASASVLTVPAVALKARSGECRTPEK